MSLSQEETSALIGAVGLTLMLPATGPQGAKPEVLIGGLARLLVAMIDAEVRRKGDGK